VAALRHTTRVERVAAGEVMVAGMAQQTAAMVGREVAAA
tara:strand:- start:1425 stop:1541 length:117 start_codon:yes stop_codon:yes gene_type:complete